MTAFVLAAALAVPAAPAQALGLEAPGELARVWDGWWQWLAALVWGDGRPGSTPNTTGSDHGSYIDPNG